MTNIELDSERRRLLRLIRKHEGKVRKIGKEVSDLETKQLERNKILEELLGLTTSVSELKEENETETDRKNELAIEVGELTLIKLN